jgi:hypothetical protein
MTIHWKAEEYFLMVLSVFLFQPFLGGDAFSKKPVIELKGKTCTILHLFSSVTQVWVPGAKTTGLIVSLVFLKSSFFGSDNFKFQCDPFSNIKDVSQMSS